MDIIAVSIVVAIASFGVWMLWRMSGSPTSTETAHAMLFDEADGWVDIVDAADQPMFRGKITGYIPDEERMLLVGGLVEGNVPSELVNDVEHMHPQRLGNGLILARCLTSPDRDVVMAQLNDESVEELIAPHVENAAAIPLCVEMNSESIVVADNNESLETFNAVWQRWCQGDTPAPPQTM